MAADKAAATPITVPAAMPVTSAAGAAQRVFRDPVTGALRAPTAEEAAALASQTPAAAKSAMGPETIVYPDGTIGQRQPARRLEQRATRAANGHLETHCHDQSAATGAAQP